MNKLYTYIKMKEIVEYKTGMFIISKINIKYGSFDFMNNGRYAAVVNNIKSKIKYE